MHGQSYGSTFVVNDDGCQMIGTASQIIGDEKFGAATDSFTYCGSIGPMKLAANMETQVAAIGDAVAREFGLRGVFGVDWVLDSDSQVWLIEINPRVPASAELYERSGVIDGLFKAMLQRTKLEFFDTAIFHGKAIVYSNFEKAIRVSKSFSDEIWAARNEPAGFADIPMPGTIVQPGAPICSLLGISPDHDSLQRQLESRAGDILRRIKKLEPVTDSSML